MTCEVDHITIFQLVKDCFAAGLIQTVYVMALCEGLLDSGVLIGDIEIADYVFK